MKKHIFILICLSVILWACNSKQKDDHSGHVHSSESHSHDHSHAEGETCPGDHDHNHDQGQQNSHNHAEGENFDHNHDHDQNNKEVHTDEIMFTPKQAKSVGLEVTTVKPASFHQVIKTSGQILSAQGDEITISATSSGIIAFNKSSLNEGFSVKAGESLISISSRNMIDGDPVLRAKSAYDIAQREFQRAESLMEDKLISQREYNEIKLNYENTKNTYQSIGGRSSARGVSISSPISGFVKTKLVSEGQYVEVGQALMTITQNRKLQLRADISERYYKDISNITLANFKTPYDKTVYTLSELNGRLVSFGKSANNQEYYIPVNFEFDNIGQIISGSYVEVFLLGQPRENVISIPISSLTEEQGIYFVYLQVHDDAYKKQEVRTGTNDGKNVEILSGIKAGDKVVSKGAYHVKLASASAAIPHAHEH